MNNLNLTCETFSGSVKDNIAFLQIHRHFLLRTENLTDRDQVLDFLDQVSSSASIKILIFAGAPEAKGRDEFFAFYKKFYDRGMDITLIHRMFNFIDQLVLKLAELEKFTIYINSGNVLASFLNLGLACDYRILSDSAVIQNPGIEMGLAAKGGGGYFLPRLVGQDHAWKIMLSDQDITAFDAIDMGLIHEIAPSEHLEEIAFSRAKEYAKKPATALSIVKQLLYFSNRGLQQYLEYEDKLLINIVKNREFWTTINQTKYQ
jgi:2-(1,2-epoxy-1,2-dihydrophenyl)acetyl-CoA isomerase